ncbi:MAG TPA: DUF3352 domain-containing protein [Candidatus Limnocylindrales bacterium]|nr:DUF3352 domain-containing protein [Candidatus Limnocylindrales bacterium]
MTDDQTQRYDLGQPDPEVENDPTMNGEITPAPGVATSEAATRGVDPAAASSTPAAATTPVPVAAAGGSKARWFVALGVVAVAIAVVIGALTFFGKPSAPEAFGYIPGDAAVVMEVRMDLPGDQLQNAGNLLAHFPGFQDQSTLPTKIDEALKRLLANAGSQVDYDKIVKPLVTNPMVLSVHSFEGMATTDEAQDVVLVATINGAFDCTTASNGASLTSEQYNGTQIWLASGSRSACAVDGRFLLIGDEPGVKSALDTHKAATGIDKSPRYQAARAQLGLDRLATLYVDGTSLAKAMPTSAPEAALENLTSLLPEWVMAGLRAESDALVLDVITAPPANPSAVPSQATYPPVHPVALTAFAPPDTLAFAESQGFSTSMHNFFTQLQANPQMAEALKQLDQFGGVDGLIGWVDEAGFVVFRNGETPAGAILLGAADAGTASAKVTALETLLGLGALGGDIDVTTSTIEGIKVTTIHIPDAGALSGTPSGAAVPLDLSIAAKDKVVVVGVGTGAMEKALGVKPGASLAEDAAYKRAIARGLANPQVVVYVAAGATIDWVESAAAALGGPAIPAEVKAYLDPVEGFIYTVIGNGVNGSFRLALTVAP